MSAVEPTGGPTAGGTPVVVRGFGFTGATGVDFGPAPAPSYTVVSDSEIRTVSPPSPGPQTVVVSVTVPGPRTSTASDDDRFTYSPG